MIKTVAYKIFAACVAMASVSLCLADEPYKRVTEFVTSPKGFTSEITFRHEGYYKPEKKWPNGMLACHGSGYYDGWRIYIEGPDELLLFQMGDKDGAGEGTSIRSFLPIERGLWTRVAVMWNPTDAERGEMRLYIDGEFVAQKSNVKVPRFPDNEKLVVGNAGYGIDPLKVEIANVECSGVLSDEEIRKHFDSDEYCRKNPKKPVDPLFKQVYDRALKLLEGSEGSAEKPNYPEERKSVTGFGAKPWDGKPENLMLFRQDGTPLKMARWPKKEGEYRETVFSNNCFRFVGDDAPKVKPGTRLLARGYWRYLWQDETLPVEAQEDGSYKVQKKHFYGFCQNPTVVLLNAPEIATEPDEWYAVDGKVHFVDPANEGIRIPGGFIHIECHGKEPGLKIQNVDYSDCLCTALRFESAEDVEISNCTFKRISAEGLLMRNCRRMVIRDCVFEDIGHNAITMENCGSRDKLIPAEIVIERCVFRRTGLLRKCFTPGIFFSGTGLIVRNCVFEDLPSSGIRLDGNDTVVRDSRFVRNMRESDDQGAIDMWGDPTYRNCVFFKNYFGPCDAFTKAPCGRAGIRLDDLISGMAIISNTFDRCSEGSFGGVQIHAGHYNAIIDNEFTGVNCMISQTYYGMKRYLGTLDSREIVQRMRGHDTSPVYLERYPELRRLREDHCRQYIQGNKHIR